MKNKTESIERYLRQEMNPEELKQFTFQMVMDKNLRKEVDQMRMIFKTIRSEAPVTQRGYGKWVFAVAAVVLLLVGSIFVFNQDDSGAAPTSPEIEQPAPNGLSAPIAFAPNEYFENLIVGTREKKDFIINEPLPRGDYYLDEQGSFAFEINTNLSGSLLPSMIGFEIWNNLPEDFDEDRFQLRKTLNVSETGKIDFKTNLELKPGLYYYVFSLKRTEEIIEIGKFSVYSK